MPSCREIDPLFAPYVDGEATADRAGVVDAHLRACPKCRHQTALQSAVRDTVRAKLCRPCAPEELRARCRAAAHGPRPFGIHARHTRLAVHGRRPRARRGRRFAVQPHGPVADGACGAAHARPREVFCRARHRRPVDARAERGSSTRATTGSGFACRGRPSPGFSSSACAGAYCGEGAAAHAMYRLNGRPVSLYIIPDAEPIARVGRRVRSRCGDVVEARARPTCSSAASRGKRSRALARAIDGEL